MFFLAATSVGWIGGDSVYTLFWWRHWVTWWLNVWAWCNRRLIFRCCVMLQRWVNVAGRLASDVYHDRCKPVLRLVRSLAICASERTRQSPVWQTVSADDESVTFVEFPLTTRVSETVPQIQSHDFWRYINLYVCMYVCWYVRFHKFTYTSVSWLRIKSACAIFLIFLTDTM